MRSRMRAGGAPRAVAPRIFPRRSGRTPPVSPRRRRRLRRRNAASPVGDRPDPHAVAGISDLLRRAGHRDREEVRLQEGRRERQLVAGRSSTPARISMRRSIISENGATVERIAAEQLVVPLAVVDVSAKAARNADYAMTQQDLADWEGEERPPARGLLRGDEFRLGAARRPMRRNSSARTRRA